MRTGREHLTGESYGTVPLAFDQELAEPADQ
jgi:hypothetical protein